MISIIIRTKNEEKYLKKCLLILNQQNFNNYEIIIIDDNSSDNTIKIAKKFKCKIIYYPKNLKFNYSKAINIAINSSKGNLISILSAHCIPYDNYWMYNAVKHFENIDVGAVYSKQIPTKNSKSSDTRDLFQVFRSETIYQSKDSYFNNASSFFRKSLWNSNKFDEKINGLEDLCWAREIQKKNYKIVYEPKSKVYHYHGINQNTDEKRLLRHIKILKDREFI